MLKSLCDKRCPSLVVVGLTLCAAPASGDNGGLPPLPPTVALAVFGGLLGVVALLAVWNLRLHRRLRHVSDRHNAHTPNLLNPATSELDTLQFRTVFDAAPVGLIVSRPDGTTMAVNPAACTMHGYTKDEFLALRPPDFIHPESLHKFSTYMESVMAGKEIHLAARDIHKDGHAFDIEVIGVPFQFNGAAHGLGILRDVTEQLETERRLQESLQVSADIMNAIPSGLLVYRYEAPDKLYLEHSNPEATQLLEEPVADLRGHEFDEIWTCPGDDQIKLAFLRVMESGQIWREDYVREKDGTCYLALSIRAFPMPDRRLGVTFEDRLEQKHIERELDQHRHHLEALVAERTRALESAQAELLRKERLATLGQVIATVSHELRNPLGTVRMSIYTIARLLKKQELDRISRSVERAERAIIRCDRIIEELLDFTRDHPLNRIHEAIDPWIYDLCDELALDKRLTVALDLQANATLYIDSDKLRRALINAINNAAQAMEEPNAPGDTLTIQSRKVGDTVHITITDQGPGIPPDIMNRIFEPLFSTKGFGVGLGVPVIRDIVESHGGTLHYESEVGTGTVTRIILPVPPPDTPV